MERPSRFHMTIGQGMILIAAFAAVLAIPHPRTVTEFRIAVCVFALLPLMLAINLLIEDLLGHPCPACNRRTLWRLATRRSFYRCTHCGGRFKRSGFGPWHDASGPEHDAVFRNKSRARRWLGFTVPENPGDTTTGRLLRNQRSRAGAQRVPDADPAGLWQGAPCEETMETDPDT